MYKTASIVLLAILSLGLTHNILPEGIPKGLPSEIKGSYRIIEHRADKTAWSVYGAMGWKKAGDSIQMLPPVYRYEYEGNNKWSIYLHEVAIENIYMEELVTIIDRKATIASKQRINEKQMPAKEIERRIVSGLRQKQIWSLKSYPYKNGLLVCGNNSVMPKVVAIWWSKGKSVFNVNGVARGNTPKFQLTFEIDVSEALQKCSTE